MLIPSVERCLDELSALLVQLNVRDYTRPCPALSGASIGEHSRHIIEMFRCLEKSYDSGIVDYDDRERNFLIQTDPFFALECIAGVRASISKPNKGLQLQYTIGGEASRIESNYERELLYNLEHCVHHQALMKVAVLECDGILIDPDFGVARSTIEYRSRCAP